MDGSEAGILSSLGLDSVSVNSRWLQSHLNLYLKPRNFKETCEIILQHKHKNYYILHTTILFFTYLRETFKNNVDFAIFDHQIVVKILNDFSQYKQYEIELL